MREESIELGAKQERTNYRSFRKNLSDYFSDYSNKSSIHGVKYLGEKKRGLLERLFWLIFIGIFLYFCISLIAKSYKKWKASPEIVSFTKSPVWKIPFPAVTICPETKSKQRVYNFTEAYHKSLLGEEMSTEDLRQLEHASLVCDNHLHSMGNKTIKSDAVDFLAEIAPQFSDVLWQCKWINQNHTCDDLLTPVLTEEGICYTFNMLDREEMFTNTVFHHGNYLQHGLMATNWTLEKGYPKDQGLDTFPRRAIAAGQKACFSLLLTLYEQDLDYICRGPVQGFKILLHSPTEMPRVSQHYLRAPLNQELVVSINPQMTITSEEFRNYNPENRQCYFDNERQLKYFKIYTQHNCQVECLADYTLKKCGCVSYHMPRNETTEICGSGSTVCVNEAQADLLIKELEVNIGIYDKTGLEPTHERCSCLPSCTSLSYNSEASQADFNWPKVFEAFKVNFSEFPGVAMTRVTFFFKEEHFTTTERSKLYGIEDFLGTCGGLLAIFIGLSFLSIVEVVYFLTLRLFCNIRKHGRHAWSGSQELLKDNAYEHNNSF